MGKPEQDAWVQRVLNAPAGGSATAAAAPGKGRGIAYPKLLLRWRQAQGTFNANLQELGKTLLARPEIQADPRIDAIRQAVDELSRLAPDFGGELEDVLDAGLTASDPAEQSRLAAAGVAAVDTYRQQLAGSRLPALETFAAKELGAGLALGSALDDALVELKRQLAAQAR